MQTKPIMFSASMIQALLDGRKTQTRRILKFPFRLHELGVSVNGYTAGEEEKSAFLDACPYGQPNDLLWVREHWRTETDYYNDLSPCNLSGEETIIYEADGNWSLNKTVGRFRQSMHMPRWASRLTLKITDVRVERVQDISDTDIEAEGIVPERCPNCGYSEWDCRLHLDHIRCGEPEPLSINDSFKNLWNSINAKRGYGWDQNPWVWAISFEVIKQNIDKHLNAE